MNTPTTRIRARRARKADEIRTRIDRIEERLIQGQMRAEALQNNRAYLAQAMAGRGLNGGLLW